MPDNQEPIVCPHCSEDNPGMIEQRNHRREQVECFCNTCGKSWVHKFNVPPEKVKLPIEVKK